ncbi:MAG: ABC transporter ATP-binding protein, partial [Clostridia bacterium]|nr:ABC transporter ATP-binding protein [Clostridia bacterium]
QAMFKNPPEELFCDGLSFGSVSRRGSMISCVVKGDESVCREYFDSLSPEFYELIPLSLEEIFITEMEEKGYDANHLIG